MVSKPSTSKGERPTQQRVSAPDASSSASVNQSRFIDQQNYVSEVKNKRRKIEQSLEVFNKFHPDFKQLQEIYDTLNGMSETDNFDDFGMYIASLLRLCPLQKGMELQKEIIKLIVISPVKLVTTIINSPVSTLMPEGTDMPPSRSDPSESVSLQDSSSTIRSTSDERLTLQQNCKSKRQHLSEVEKCEKVGEGSRLNGGVLDILVKGIDDALWRLDVVSKKIKTLYVKDDNFNTFGSYVASLLRFLPFQEGMGLQPKIINIILRCQVNALSLKL
ncbi:hypothetical protein C0J52_24082 [Blattella germanica]|nr:hypothetical protein C0J52_24082 [Blattella germanica]